MPLNVTQKQKDLLLKYLTPFVTSNSTISDHRARLEKIDALIERSYSPNRSANCKDEKAPPAEDEVTIPVVGPQVSTQSAQLAKIFLRTDPPLQMFSAPAAAQIANQYNILYSRYSRNYQWRRNILMCLQDAVSYNFCAAEVSWISRAVKSITQEVSISTGSQKLTTSFDSGERIKHLHPYNVIWDASVPLNEVSSRGAYVGYIEQFTRIALAQYFADNAIVISPDDWKSIRTKESAQSSIGYYEPRLNAVPTPEKVELSFDEIFDGKSSKEIKKTSTALYTVTTLFLRVIPMDFDIISESAASVNILKVTLIGDDFIADVRILDNAHNIFPVIFGQTKDTTLGLNSFTMPEELAPIQNTATKLYNAEIASSRRLISDRAIYDPQLISAKEVNNPSPTAKIPLRSSMHGSFALSNAYYAIPYEDRALGVRISQANNLLGFSSQIAATNPTMQGQFVKGNKTAGEFNTTMAMAGDRLLQSAIFLDDQFFAPLRTILMSDTLQYQNDVTVFDRETGQFLKVNMAELRDAPLDFDIAAGLLPANELVSTEFFQVLIQTFMSRQDLAMDFKAIDALCYLAETQGVKYLSRFLRTDQEKVQFIQRQLAIQAASVQAQQPQQGGNPQQ
jgi:hypothetical protein